MNKKTNLRKKKYIYFTKIYLAVSVCSILSINDTLSMFPEEETAEILTKTQKKTYAGGPKIELIEVNSDHNHKRTLTQIEEEDQPKIELIPFVMEKAEQEDSYLHSFIQKYLVEKEEIPESKLKKSLRIATKSVSVVLGGLSGIPYFAVGRDAGGENEIVSWGVGLTNTVAISGIGSWSYFNLVKGLDPQSPEEKALLQKTKFNLPAHLASHALGLVVAVPTGYMAARYNTYKWLALISFGTDYTLKTNGFLTLLNHVTAPNSRIKKCFSLEGKEESEIEASVLNTQQLLVNHLSKKTIPTLLTMRDEERENLIVSLYQADNQTVESYLSSLLSLASPEVSPLETPETWKKGYPRTAFVSALSSSAFINVIHNSVCAYSAWSMLYDNPAFDVPMAALSTLPIFMLELNATIKTGHALYDTVFYRVSGKPQPSLEHSLYPKLMRAAPVLSVALAGVTAYVGRFMVEDILTGVLPQEYATFLTVGGVLGPFLFASYANYSLMKDILVGCTRSYGNEPKKKLVLLMQDVEKLAQVIKLTKLEEMKKFLENSNIQNTLSILNREATEEESSGIQGINLGTDARRNSRFRFSCELL
ncbi:MAG: hypothetical protein KBD36_03605 [Alphaproteobacteria bacterium]|jgi:hypothetical protein|nr:hypothetical protein [Alphaproteobacteria bacterium]MBP9776909.1 hypothetical protein [Alphaproteobacteria bacterium]